MSRGNEQGDFFAEQGREAYRRWQKIEEGKDALAQKAHNRLIIENADPELEAAVKALEQGWLEGR